jgi:uncharacterized protein YrrD
MYEHKLTIGAHVYSKGGKFGKLTKVAIDPNTWQVTDLIVEDGFLMKRSRVFPVSLISAAMAQEIHLAITDDELDDFQDYKEDEYEYLSSDWEETTLPDAGAHSVETAAQLLDQYGLTVERLAPIVYRKTHSGLAYELAVVEKGTSIFGRAGKIGHLDRVGTDALSGQVTDIVVRSGLLGNERLRIPARLVESVTEECIRISASKKELEALETAY